MDPACVVAADPGEDLAACLVSGREPGLGDEFSFEGGEERLGDAVVLGNWPIVLRIGAFRVGPAPRRSRR